MNRRNIESKIILLSGENDKIKRSTIEMLFEKLKEQGYAEEQIHLETTEKEFKNYFNSIIEMVLYLNDDKVLSEIEQRKEIKKILDNREYRKTLIKTIINLQSRKNELSNFSIQNINNKDIYKPIKNIIKMLIDEDMKEKVEKIKETQNSDDIWILDTFHNISEKGSISLTDDSKPEDNVNLILKELEKKEKDGTHEESSNSDGR